MREGIRLGGLAGFLAAYNNVLNAVPAASRVYVPLNLAVAAGLLAVGRSEGLSWQQLGLGAPPRRGLRLGAGVAALVAGVLAAALALPATARLLRDERVAGLGLAQLAYRALVRIPLGTVALEEVAFRGVLFGLLARHHSPAAAVAGSSALFGVWHVAPTVVALRTNDVVAGRLATASGVIGGVATTSAAGALLCALRIHGGGLLAPTLAHVATNSLGAAAAYVALRRSGTRAAVGR